MSLLQISRRRKNVNFTIMRSLCLVGQYLSSKNWVWDSPHHAHLHHPLLPNMTVGGWGRWWAHTSTGHSGLGSSHGALCITVGLRWEKAGLVPSWILYSFPIAAVTITTNFWLKTTQLYYFTVQEGRSPKIKVLARLYFFWWHWRRTCFLALCCF